MGNVTIPPNRPPTQHSSARDNALDSLAVILQAWPKCGLDPTDPLSLWAKSHEGLSRDAVEFGWQIIATEPREFPPTPAQLRAMCLRYAPPTAPPRRELIADETEYSAASGETRHMLVKRLIGKLQEGPVSNRIAAVADLIPRKRYSGNFPCQMVCNSVQIDWARRRELIADGRMQPLIDFDQKLFDECKRTFNREWSTYHQSVEG